MNSSSVIFFCLFCSRDECLGFIAPSIPSGAGRPSPVKLNFWNGWEILLDYLKKLLWLGRVFLASDRKHRGKLIAHCRGWNSTLNSKQEMLVSISEPVSGADVDLVPHGSRSVLEAPGFHDLHGIAQHRCCCP